MDYEYQQFPATLKEMARELNRIVDDYRARRLGNDDFIEIIRYYADAYPERLFDGPEYNITMQRIVGQRRLAIIDKVMDGQQLTFKGVSRWKN